MSLYEHVGRPGVRPRPGRFQADRQAPVGRLQVVPRRQRIRRYAANVRRLPCRAGPAQGPVRHGLRELPRDGALDRRDIQALLPAQPRPTQQQQERLVQNMPRGARELQELFMLWLPRAQPGPDRETAPEGARRQAARLREVSCEWPRTRAREGAGIWRRVLSRGSRAG